MNDPFFKGKAKSKSKRKNGKIGDFERLEIASNILEEYSKESEGGTTELQKKIRSDFSRLKSSHLESVNKKLESVNFSDVKLSKFKRERSSPITSFDVDESRGVLYYVTKRGKIKRFDGKQSKFLFNKSNGKENFNILRISDDGRILAVGTTDGNVYAYNIFKRKLIGILQGHKGSVNALAFSKDTKRKKIEMISEMAGAPARRGGNDEKDLVLLTGGSDSLVKLWVIHKNTAEEDRIVGEGEGRIGGGGGFETRGYSISFSEDLFGHFDSVLDLDMMSSKFAVSSSADETLRYWKIDEESHLVFENGHDLNIDCVRMVNDQYFVSAGEDGTINLWRTSKKKPIDRVKNAHGEGVWITSLAVARNRNFFVTGGSDGSVMFWKLGAYKSFLNKIVSLGEKLSLRSRMVNSEVKQSNGMINELFIEPSSLRIWGIYSYEGRLGSWKSGRAFTRRLSYDRKNGRIVSNGHLQKRNGIFRIDL